MTTVKPHAAARAVCVTTAQDHPSDGWASIDWTAANREVERLQQDLEELLEPFINRHAEDRPSGSSPVRITAYFLPEPLVP